MFARTIKFIVGILIIPIAVAISIVFFKQLGFVRTLSYPSSQFFLWGVVAYTGMHLFLFKPRYLYTLGHEATHALATWFCGGKVTGFNVSKKGGAVSTTKNNFFISLSPYFFPFYTLVISLVYFLGSLFYNLSYFSGYFIFLVGLTLSMHIISTVEVMRMEQPDILRTGYIFSVVLIYIINIALIALIVSLLFRELSFTWFLSNSYSTSKAIYIKVFKQLFWI